MLSIAQCKKVLGNEANLLSDEAVEAVRDELYIAANLAFDSWQKKGLVSAKDKAMPSPFVSTLPAPAEMQA
ncbi:MAG: hypothetical protein WDN10_00275 [bacterium]